MKELIVSKMNPSLRRKYRFVEKLIEKYKSIPEDQQKHRDIIKTKLGELRKDIENLKRSTDTCVDRQSIISQINTLRASGRHSFSHPVDDKRYTTEQLQLHLEYCNRKLKGG